MKQQQWGLHLALIAGLAVLLLPVYMAFVAASHPLSDLLQAPLPLLPGQDFFTNLQTILTQGVTASSPISAWGMLGNSFVMAMFITVGKLSVSFLSAYAIVYFDFPAKKFLFWMIFLTLLLPVEVRIVPTFQVAANLNLLNSFSGLSLPLIASATATFLFRQFFMTLPKSLFEAAKLDGSGPLRILWDIVLPLSKTNLAALFVILFVYAWNQYLWPLVITTDPHKTTIVMGIKQLASVADQTPLWHLIMSTALLALLVPLCVVLVMQKWFVKGLVDIEK